MYIRQIFERDRGDIMMIIISLLAGLLFSHLDFANLKSSTSEEIALIIYTLFIVIPLYVTVTYIHENRKQKKIKVNPVFYFDKNKDFIGSSYFCGLEIKAPEGWDVTNCYAVIENINPIYNDKRKYFDKQVRDFFNYSKTQYKNLSWRSPYSSNCTIDIKEPTFSEIVNVGQINIGFHLSKEKRIDIQNFEFCFCQNKPNEYKMGGFGLYEISISIHWRLNGIKRNPIVFDGYLFSEIREIGGGFEHSLKLCHGDYREDKEIPTPLFRVK